MVSNGGDGENPEATLIQESERLSTTNLVSRRGVRTQRHSEQEQELVYIELLAKENLIVTAI